MRGYLYLPSASCLGCEEPFSGVDKRESRGAGMTTSSSQSLEKQPSQSAGLFRTVQGRRSMKKLRVSEGRRQSSCNAYPQQKEYKSFSDWCQRVYLITKEPCGEICYGAYLPCVELIQWLVCHEEGGGMGTRYCGFEVRGRRSKSAEVLRGTSSVYYPDPYYTYTCIYSYLHSHAAAAGRGHMLLILRSFRRDGGRKGFGV